jgi:hypothetical protein
MNRLRPWLGGCGAVLVAIGTSRLLRVPALAPSGVAAAETAHFGSQRVREVRFEVAANSVPLGVALTWSGDVSGVRDGVIRFAADPSLQVVLATQDGAALEEREPATRAGAFGLIARSAALRELAGARSGAGRLEVRALMPRPRGRPTAAMPPPGEWFRVASGIEKHGLASSAASPMDDLPVVRDALAPPPTAAPGGGTALPFRVNAFAVQRDGDRLAVALPVDERGGSGVLLLAGDGDSLGERQRYALPRVPRELEWVAGGDALLVRFDGDGAALLEVARGAVRWLEDEVIASADGFALLERREVASGAFVQRRHDLRSAAWGARRIAGTRPAAFAALADHLCQAAADGTVECLADDGSVSRRLATPFFACRAAIPTPIGWCCVIDGADGTRVEVPAAGGATRRIDAPVAAWHFAIEPDGSMLRIAGACSVGGDGARFALAEVALLGPHPASAVRVTSCGGLAPIAPPDRHGLLLVEPAAEAVRGTVTRHDVDRMVFHLPARSFGTSDIVPRPCVRARLDVRPVVGGSGRYLYFLRGMDGALWRHDLLLGGEVPLVAATR